MKIERQHAPFHLFFFFFSSRNRSQGRSTISESLNNSQGIERRMILEREGNNAKYRWIVRNKRKRCYLEVNTCLERKRENAIFLTKNKIIQKLRIADGDNLRACIFCIALANLDIITFFFCFNICATAGLVDLRHSGHLDLYFWSLTDNDVQPKGVIDI